MLSGVKSFIRDTLGIPSWIALAFAGLVVHLMLNWLLRKPSTSAWGLLAPMTLGAAVEAYEIWVQYRVVGLFAPGNDPLWMILGRHSLDILKMLALPGIWVIAAAAITGR